jgi:mono/diheme cytochrome c family protein
MRTVVFLLVLIMLAALTWAQGAPETPLFQEGKEVFENICADCHRLNGQGLPGTYPALAKNSFVVGDPKPVILTVLNGRKGALGQMPAWKDRLSDQQIAGAITFIRNSWSNRAPAVNPAQVAAARQK